MANEKVMNRTDFIKEVVSLYEKTYPEETITLKKTKKIADVMSEVLRTIMKEEGAVIPFEGMKFSGERKKAATYRNPITGEPVSTAEKTVPKMHFTKTFKDFIAE